MTVDDFTMLVIGGCVGLAFWFIREMTESFALAAFCTPILLVGALAANYLFRVNFIIAVQDKDSNILIASAAGVICALILVLVSIWISVLMSERRSEKRELAQLPSLPPSGH
jgi:predicted membrane-bound spermidine synthase